MWYIARQAAGKAKHHHREEPRHECAGSGIAREEAFQIARHTVIVPEDEPGNVVDDVVQTGNDQHPIQHAVSEQPEGACMEHRAAERVHPVLEVLPLHTEQPGENQSRETRSQ